MKKRPASSGRRPKNGYTTGDVISDDFIKKHNISNKLGLIHTTVMPLFLISVVPNFVLIIWYTAVHCDGSWAIFGKHVADNGLVEAMSDIWRRVDIASPLSVAILLGYSLWSVVLMLIVPGPRTEGPITPKGNIPVYKDNGFYCYILTILAFLAITLYCRQNGLPSPSIVYDHFGDFLATLTIFSFVLCVGLQIKGLYFPSTSDNGSSGNIIFDFYWGTELYPRVCGVDIKVFTNCRFGMTVWPLLVCIFTLKSYELHGFVDSIWVSSLLHMAYFTKFFWWEAGYMRTIDIMVDRAGYYICWGCLVFIPGLYACTSLYFVNHPVHLGPVVSGIITVVGLGSLVANYWADYQKQVVRATNGRCTIWGRKPSVIHAKYRLENGSEKGSLLLISGWWGVSRHFHYVPELTLAFCWCVPALFTHVMPYTYFIFLFILLTHRTFRDDEKCSVKYGKYWNDYCQKVPYRMIPYIF